jgi:hypothetical protein
MIAETLKDLLSRASFRPFRIITSGGKSYDVLTPDLVVVMRSELFIALPDGDHFVFCPYRNIALVESLQAA